MQLKREVGARKEAEMQLLSKDRELQAMRTTFEASQLAAEQLEGELMEAAQDVLQSHKLQTHLQVPSPLQTWHSAHAAPSGHCGCAC